MTTQTLRGLTRSVEAVQAVGNLYSLLIASLRENTR